MANTVDIRKGIATNLGNIAGLRVYPFVTGTIVTPAAVVIPGDGGRGNKRAIDYDQTMGRGSDMFFFTVLLLVTDAVERASTDTLDEYLAGSGALSVKQAIESDETLGGIVGWTNVQGVADYGRIDYGGQSYLGAEFQVEVMG
jgi:hypothetical protein